MADNSCLRSPDLRNDFEHFDERLVKAFGGEDPELRGFVGRNIGPMDASFLAGEGEDASSWFGHYDPSTGALSFWDNEINVFEVVKETQRIKGLVDTEVNQPLRIG